MSLLSSHFYVLFLVRLTYEVQITVSKTFLLKVNVTHHLVFDVSNATHELLCSSDIRQSKIEWIFNKVKSFIRFQYFSSSEMPFVNGNFPGIQSFFVFALLLLVFKNEYGLDVAIGSSIVKKCISSRINFIKFASIFN